MLRQIDEEFYDACENINEMSNLYMTMPVIIRENTNESPIATTQTSRCESPPSRNSSHMNHVEIISAGLKIINRSKTISNKPKELYQFNNIQLIQEIDLVDKRESGTWVIKFSPDQKSLVIGGQIGVVCLYDIMNTQQKLIEEAPSRIFAEHEGMITDIDFNAEGNILTSSLDGSVKLWWKCQENSIYTFKHATAVNAVCSHPLCRNVFATASKDSMIRQFRLPEKYAESLYKTPREVTALAYSPDGEYLAAGLKKGEVIIYQSLPETYKLRLKYTLKCRNRFGLKRGGRRVTNLEFMNHDYLLVTTNDSRIRLYKFKENLLVQKYKGNINSKFPIRASFSPHKAHIICGSEKGRFFIWNTFKQTEGEKIEKNTEFESFDARVNKGGEFSIFAPEGVVEAAKEWYREGEVTHMILSAGSNDTLRIFLNVA